MSNVQTPTPASLDRYTLSVREFLEGLLSEKDLPLTPWCATIWAG